MFKDFLLKDIKLLVSNERPASILFYIFPRLVSMPSRLLDIVFGIIDSSRCICLVGLIDLFSRVVISSHLILDDITSEIFLLRGYK